MRKVLTEVKGFIGAFVIFYGLILIALIPAEMYMNGQVYIFEDLGRIKYVVAYGIMALVLTVGSEICRITVNKTRRGKWFED